MTAVEQQIEELRAFLGQYGANVTTTKLPSSAHLIEITNYTLPPGWNQVQCTILFVAPPAYPSAQPDCFWVEPVGIRLSNQKTPQNTNDSNPIPEVGPRGTWFSWHIQGWKPDRDTLVTYLNAIKHRLEPAR